MIALENVRLRFDSRGIAGLSGVSFTLKEGTVTTLMGPNGSGKTTLLKILAGEIKADEGKVKTEDAVRFIKDSNIDPELNVQKYLISRTNPEVSDEKKIQLARDLADIFEFTFQLRQNVGQLSAGQRQKVYLAGELISNPRLVLLDEPFTHLDPHTRKDILSSLFDYIRRQNLTLLCVTHDVNEAARFSDHMILLQHGKIEQEGNPEEVFSRPKNIFVAQFLGFHNFFPVKKSGDFWETPWGKEKFSPSPENEDALLVVPDLAWEMDPSSKIRAQLEEQYFSDTLWTIRGRLEDRVIQIKTLKKPANLPQSFGVIPRMSDCFLITL